MYWRESFHTLPLIFLFCLSCQSPEAPLINEEEKGILDQAIESQWNRNMERYLQKRKFVDDTGPGIHDMAALAFAQNILLLHKAAKLPGHDNRLNRSYE